MQERVEEVLDAQAPLEPVAQLGGGPFSATPHAITLEQTRQQLLSARFADAVYSCLQVCMGAWQFRCLGERDAGQVHPP